MPLIPLTYAYEDPPTGRINVFGRVSCNDPWSFRPIQILAMSVKEKHPAVALAEKRLKMHIARHLPNARVWLFGSRATGAALRRSDFDLAVQPGSESLDTELIDFEASIRDDFEIIFPVDVVYLRRAPEWLKQSIEKDGILWKN